MKTQTGALVLIALAALASYVLRPGTDLRATEKSEHMVAQAQAQGPTPTLPKGLDVITEPNPSIPIKYDVVIKAGIVQSTGGRRTQRGLILDLLQRDVVKLSVPPGESAVVLSGGITYSLNPGEQVYIQTRVPLPQDVFISISGRKTDTIVFNTK